MRGSDEHREKPEIFCYRGGQLPSFNVTGALVRALGITLISVVLAELLVFAIYAVVDVENTPFHALVTLVVTLLVAFPVAYYFSAQRYKMGRVMAQLDRSSRYDMLSGLYNRATFDHEARAVLRLCDERQQGVSVVFFDADHFKRLNDKHGHAVGDQAIALIGETIFKFLGPRDIAGRVGGEEFCALLVGRGVLDAEAVAGRVILAISSGSKAAGLPAIVTVSAGVAAGLPDESFRAMCKRADDALYRAKNAGRNRVMRDETPASSYSSGATTRASGSAA